MSMTAPPLYVIDIPYATNDKRHAVLAKLYLLRDVIAASAILDTPLPGTKQATIKVIDQLIQDIQSDTISLSVPGIHWLNLLYQLHRRGRSV